MPVGGIGHGIVGDIVVGVVGAFRRWPYRAATACPAGLPGDLRRSSAPVVLLLVWRPQPGTTHLWDGRLTRLSEFHQLLDATPGPGRGGRA
jgi:hypothetical protein